MKESATNANNMIDKLLEFINKTNRDNNQFIINNIYENYIQFLNTLTTLQRGAIAHILVSICVLFLISNILIAYYSNKLITYFNLETKYPRLLKYMQLRRKL